MKERKKQAILKKNPFCRKAATVSAPSLEILKVGLHDGNYKGDGNNDDYNNNDDNDSNDEYDTIITTMMTTTKNGMVHGLSLWLSAGRRLLGDEDVDSAENDNAEVQTGGGV